MFACLLLIIFISVQFFLSLQIIKNLFFHTTVDNFLITFEQLQILNQTLFFSERKMSGEIIVFLFRFKIWDLPWNCSEQNKIKLKNQIEKNGEK